MVWASTTQSVPLRPDRFYRQCTSYRWEGIVDTRRGPHYTPTDGAACHPIKEEIARESFPAGRSMSAAATALVSFDKLRANGTKNPHPFVVGLSNHFLG